MIKTQNKTHIGGELDIDIDILNSNISNINLLNDYEFFDSGRSAFSVILDHLKVDEILIPSYLCDSIIQVLEKKNIKYKYFKIDSSLNINIDEMYFNAKKYRIKTVLFINYFGKYLGHKDRNKLTKLKNELNLIEDCTHLTFIPTINNEYEYIGDYVFGSLRKVFMITDGGFLYNNQNYNYKLECNNDEFINSKLIGKLLRKYYIKNKIDDTEIEKIYLNILLEGEEYLKNSNPSEMSKLSKEILLKTDFNKIWAIRNNNYLYIDDQLLSIPILQNKVKKLFNNVKPCFPYMYPILIENRDLVRSKLIKENIFTSIIWNTEFTNEKMSNYISKHILCLPIDQRYQIKDMEVIINKLTAILEEIYE